MASKKKYKPVKHPKQQVLSEGIKKTQPKRSAVNVNLLPGRWQIHTGIFLLLVLGTLWLYSSDLHLGFFAVDDPGYVTKNPWIKSVNSTNIYNILSQSYFANYSPLHLFSYMIDYALAGENAYAFHFSSNLWAGIVAGFVFLTSLAFTKNRIISIAAAVLFVVHPVHVEAVAWISSRKDLVAAAFALPSFLAYMQYRNTKSAVWYAVSVILFLFALAGKLSVATFPAVFLAYDFFIEKRLLRNSIADKIPFLVLALIIALKAMSAQPSMGHQPEPYVLAAALVQNFWLLSGFATYVLYRIPPETSQALLQIGGVIFLIAIFLAPFFIRKKMPAAAVLLYWILFAFIPAQVLSFTHPVTDRYVFFPSVAGVILLAWGIYAVTQKITAYGTTIFAAILLLLSVLWGRNTLRYLSEWNDPRSVWYAAMEKSADPAVSQNLGSYYVGVARSLGAEAGESPLSKEKMIRLANLTWTGNNRLPELLDEWKKGQKGGVAEMEFKNHLLDLAWDALEKTIQNKGNRIMGAAYYNRGLILQEKNNWEGAKKEFEAGAAEALRDSFAESGNELAFYCYYSLGRIGLKQLNYPEALKWFQLAKKQQDNAKATWIPGVEKTIRQLEEAIAKQSVQ